MNFRREAVDDNGRGNVEEKKGKSVATASAEEGNGVAHMGSKEINLAAQGNGSRQPSPNHQSEEEKMEQIIEESEVYINISSRLENDSPSNWQNYKIFKVHHEPEDEKFYKPSIISIGPYYHGGKQLEAMEAYKVHFLNRLLKRSQDKSLAAYVCKMTSLVGDARGYYSELPQELEKDSVFSQMMLLDGCFIVELIHQLRQNKRHPPAPKGGRLALLLHFLVHKGLGPRNSLDLALVGRLPSILHDLALVENQLPFFVLWELLGISVANDEEKYECIQLLLSTFKRKMPGVKTFDKKFGEVTNVKHLVDLLHSLWSTSDHNDKREPLEVDKCQAYHKGKNEVDEEREWISSIGEGEHVKWTHINSASELIEAGIQFKKAEGNLFDINFKNGKFNIPSLIIEDRTESLYHNIIAYEQRSMLIEESGDDKRYSKRAKLTFYCRLMDCLINSEKDVQILRKRGIIVNCLGDDGAVARMFNRLGVHVGHISYGFFYAQLFNDVNKYYDKPWNKWKTILLREHLKSPWAYISLAAAVILLVLTALQTQFAVFPLRPKGG